MFRGIDFYSDTVTKPTEGMRRAMASAEVGDEQKGEDPTTLQLETKVADLLHHTAATFFPSATMANEVAVRLHCEPGDELYAAESAHLFAAEAGGPAVHSGVLARPIATPNGIFSGEDLSRAHRWMKGPHFPIPKLVSVENTTNMGGGYAWPIAALEEVVATAKALQLKTHLDGSRLFNAVVATKTTPHNLAEHFDTVTICFSKGLGAPVGAVLAYDRAHAAKVRRYKQLMGGAMRQSGVLAAACLYALNHHVDRLSEDHENAERLASGLHDIPSIEVENFPPATNMVFFRWKGACTPEEFSKRSCEAGVRFSHVGPNRFRAVTHLDIRKKDIDSAIAIISRNEK